MEDKILVNLSTDHTFECNVEIIGREGEGNTTRFEITVPEGLTGCSVYLDFEKPNGEKFRSPKLKMENGVAIYDVVPYLLTDDGEIKVQAVLVTNGGQTWKSYTKRYIIPDSIDALEEIPKKEDFIADVLSNVTNALKGKKSGGAVAMTDISPLEHILDVKVTGATKVKKLGKNLTPFPYKSLRGEFGKGATDTHNGITYTVNGDGSITMNGTATGLSIFYLNSSAYSWKLGSGKYAFDRVANNSYYYSVTLIDDVTGVTTEVNNSYDHKGRTIELANESTVSAYRIAIAQGVKVNNLTVYPQLELGSFGTEYEPYVEPVEYNVNADGTVEGVKPIYPCTTLMTDTVGAVIDVEYNRDINKAFEELYNAIISLGGNV